MSLSLDIILPLPKIMEFAHLVNVHLLILKIFFNLAVNKFFLGGGVIKIDGGEC